MSEADEKKPNLRRRGRGEGSFEQLPSGKWRAIVVLGRDPETRKRVRLTHTADTKREVKQWLDARNSEKNEGKIGVGGRVGYGVWLTRWLELKRQHVENSTLKFYTSRVERHIRPHLGGVRLCDLRAEHFLEVHAKMTKANVPLGEQRRCAKTWRASIASAIDLGLIAVNPATKLKMPKLNTTESQAFTLEQARNILSKATGWFAVYVRLAFDTGARPGELFGLHWPEVTLTDPPSARIKWSVDASGDKAFLKPPKTAKGRRTILISRPTADALTVLRKDQERDKRPNPNGLVFPNSDGGFLSISNLSFVHWKPLLRLARVPLLGLYASRHTSATLLLSDGVNVKVVSERLGHEDVVTTLKAYSHVLPTMQAVAAETAGRLFPMVPQTPHRKQMNKSTRSAKAVK
jgi:integrase